MAVLDTVGDYVAQARALLQDTMEPYRYSTADLKDALGIGLYEVRRFRPDIFAFGTLPDLTNATADGTAVGVERQFRYPLVHFMCGHVQIRDDEDSSEGRAVAFMASFRSKLLEV